MAYDEGLAHRLRELCEAHPGVSEKKMFGGLCFMVAGNMCFGVVGDELMVRVGPDAYPGCLAQPHVREMDFTGRALKGMIYVGTEGFAEDEDLEAWAARGLEFAGSLPAKVPGKAAAKKVAGKAAQKRAGKKKAAKKRAARKKSPARKGAGR